MRRAVLIALVAALVAGCGSHGGPRVVPWVPAPPPSPAPASRPCAASDLRATPVLSSATGGLVGEIHLRNAGAEPCSLVGTPAVKLRPALPQAVTRYVVPDAGLPASWLHSVTGGRQVSLPVALFNWCFPAKTPTLLLTLPGGNGRLAVPLHEGPRCIVPATPTTISLGSFQPSSGQGVSWTQQLGARIAPETLRARPGHVLRYLVELTNNSQQTLELTPCPFASQALQRGAKPRLDQLNCRPAGSLKPSRSVRFRMELAIPATAPEGSNRLTWTLDPFSSHPLQTTAPVQIAAP
jgi:hypothetical protein